MNISKIRKWVRRSPVVQCLYYGLHIDEFEQKLHKTLDAEIDRVLPIFLSQEEMKNSQIIEDVRKDIKRCYHLVRTNATEYFMFDLRYKNTQERKTYLSDKFILSELTKKGQRKLHDTELQNKYNFYLINKDYFNRDVIEVKSSSDYDSFESMALKNKEIILKPNTESCGAGIFAAQTSTKEDCVRVFSKLMALKGEWIIEKKVIQCHDMAQWNKTSVNTIRIITYNNSRGVYVDRYPFFRTGRAGCVVDNAGEGGVYALIDPDTGTILTDGMDERHNTYKEHPDSHIVFKGAIIPHFKEAKELAIKIHKENMNKHIMIGWDLALTNEGWTIIEGNWGTCVCQQSQVKRGLKYEFLNNIKS